jgi:LAS superfamily LD-carboxypeptidase LdcB
MRHKSYLLIISFFLLSSYSFGRAQSFSDLFQSESTSSYHSKKIELLPKKEPEKISSPVPIISISTTSTLNLTTRETSKKIKFTKATLESISDSACAKYLSNNKESEDYFLDIPTSGLGSYVPPNLQKIPNTYLVASKKTICLQKKAKTPLINLIEKAKKDNLTIKVLSGFRTHDHQKKLFKRFDKTTLDITSITKPGFSEHQLGLAVDIGGASTKYNISSSLYRTSPEYIWLLENAPQFGFEQSYKEGSVAQSGIIAEPWHWKYIK